MVLPNFHRFIIACIVECGRERRDPIFRSEVPPLLRPIVCDLTSEEISLLLCIKKVDNTNKYCMESERK